MLQSHGPYHRGGHHALCHANDPWHSNRGCKKVRWIEARSNNYAKKEVLFPGVVFQQGFASGTRWRTDTNSFKKTRRSGAAGLAYRANIPAGPRLVKF